MATDGGDSSYGAVTDAAAWLADASTAGSWSLDPAASEVGFHVRHFWGAVTVHGTFGKISGEGTVGPGGAVQGQLRIEAASVTTKNQRRDEHLRSADFFSVKDHPEVLVTVTGTGPAGSGKLALRGTLEAAGHSEPLEFTAELRRDAPRAITLRAELLVDRTRLDMNWRPMGVASKRTRLTASLRFNRS